MLQKFNTLIIGGGSWGRSIAFNALQSNAVESVTIYSRQELQTQDKATLTSIGNNINFTNLLTNIKVVDIVFIAIPLKAFEEFFTQNAKVLQKISKNFVICSKGYIKSSLQSGYEFLQVIFDNDCNLAVLSGPNFSSEVMLSKPTITTIASKSETLNNIAKQCLTTNYFKCQLTTDTTGVSLLGLCKNAIAIGFGLICGSDEEICNSTNAKSMYLSLIINETANLITKIGGDFSSVNLSCGIGDIFLSCSDLKSRNVSFGIDFGSHFCKQDFINNKQDLIKSLTAQKTVEGIDSIFVIYELAKLHNINLDTYSQIYKAIFDKNFSYKNFINNIFSGNL